MVMSYQLDYPVINLYDNVVVLQYKSSNMILCEDQRLANKIANTYLHNCNKTMWSQLMYRDIKLATYVIDNIKKYYGRNIASFIRVSPRFMILEGYLTF